MPAAHCQGGHGALLAFLQSALPVELGAWQRARSVEAVRRLDEEAAVECQLCLVLGRELRPKVGIRMLGAVAVPGQESQEVVRVLASWRRGWAEEDLVEEAEAEIRPELAEPSSLLQSHPWSLDVVLVGVAAAGKAMKHEALPRFPPWSCDDVLGLAAVEAMAAAVAGTAAAAAAAVVVVVKA